MNSLTLTEATTAAEEAEGIPTAEEVLENRGRRATVETATPQSFFTVFVIDLALLRVTQHLIRMRDVFELA